MCVYGDRQTQQIGSQISRLFVVNLKSILNPCDRSTANVELKSYVFLQCHANICDLFSIWVLSVPA